MRQFFLTVVFSVLTFSSQAAFSQGLDVYSDQWAPIYSIHEWGTNPPWQHREVQSSSGTNVKFDYQLGYSEYRGGGVDGFAHELWVHVSNKAFKGDEQIRVVLVQKHREYVGGVRTTVTSLDLEASGPQTYSGNLERLFLGNGTYDIEAAVVIDDIWLIDPVTGEHNFRPDFLAPVRR